MTFKRVQRQYDEKALYEYAIAALGRRARSVAELKRLMRSRVAHQAGGEEMIEAIVARLKERRYLNDAGYAATYCSFRKENEKFGRMRVVQDLKAKGVHPEVIDHAVGAAYEGVNEEQLAREFLRRKRVLQPADQRQAARVFRTLMRAGFSSRVIVAILKKWNVDDETLTALEQEQEEAAEAASRQE